MYTSWIPQEGVAYVDAAHTVFVIQCSKAVLYAFRVCCAPYRKEERNVLYLKHGIRRKCCIIMGVEIAIQHKAQTSTALPIELEYRLLS